MDVLGRGPAPAPPVVPVLGGLYHGLFGPGGAGISGLNVVADVDRDLRSSCRPREVDSP